MLLLHVNDGQDHRKAMRLRKRGQFFEIEERELVVREIKVLQVS